MGEDSSLHLEGIYEGDPEKLLLSDSALSVPTKLAQAERLLEEAIQNGDVKSKVLLRMAAAQGISPAVLSPARKKLHRPCEKRPDGWYVLCTPAENTNVKSEDTKS